MPFFLILSCCIFSFVSASNVFPGEFEPCRGRPGLCIDNSLFTCSGYTVGGLCSGPASIRCCPAPAKVISKRCLGGKGLCMNEAHCPGTARRGLCPGPSTVTCCIKPIIRINSASIRQSSSTTAIDLKYACSSRWISRAGKNLKSKGWKISMRPKTQARLFARSSRSWRSIYRDLKSCVPFPKLTTQQDQSVFEQLACHAKWSILPVAGGETWDFEVYRPSIGIRRAVGRFLPPRHRCNW